MATLATTDALELLSRGELDIEGRLVDASNTTLRATISCDGVSARCVYKPVRGERPLWDFPDGTLAGREVSAFLVGDATGWAPGPPSAARDETDRPYVLAHADDPRLARLAALDVV